MRNTKELRGARVVGGRSGNRRIGKVLKAVFRPDTFDVAGFLIQRPDLLLMIKRDESFLAYDAFRVADGRVVATIDNDSWGPAACRRIGLDWDNCLLLEGMPLVTVKGVEIGRIDGAEYDERNGKVTHLTVSDGLTARALLGEYSIPIDQILRYEDGNMVAKAQASKATPEGGLAARAGEGAAIAGAKVGHVAAKAGAAAGKAVDKGARATGEAIGKAGKQVSAKTGKAVKGFDESASQAVEKGSKALGRQLNKSKGMFAAFKEEYKKASKGE